MFIGNGIYQGSAYVGYVITLTYTVDSYNANVPEMLMIICACKQTISFGLGFDLLSWITNDGMGVITAGFATILLVVTAQLFYFFGVWIEDQEEDGEVGHCDGVEVLVQCRGGMKKECVHIVGIQ